MAYTPRLILIGVFVLAALVYLPVSEGPLVYEDANAVAVPFAWSWPVVLHSVPGRTVTVWSLAQTLHDARRAHLVNLGLHLVAGALVAALAYTVAGSTAMVVAAVVHLWHPLNSQAVSYVSGRGDILMAVGLLLALWGAVQSHPWRMVAVGAGLLLAAASKEIGVVGVPLVVWTLLVWRPADAKRTPATALWVVGGAVIGRAWGAVTTWIQMPPGGGGPDVSWPEFVVRQVGLTGALLWKVVDPRGFSIDHDAMTLTQAEMVVALLALATLVAVAVLGWRRAPMLSWVIGLVLIGLLPRLVVPTNEFIAERHLYAAMAAMAVLIGWATAAWLRPQPAGARFFWRQYFAQSRALSHAHTT